MRKLSLFLASLAALALAGCAAPRIAPPGDLPGAPEIASRHFITHDGLPLPLRRWAPEGAPSAVVIGLHGFNDYARAFEDVGPKLAAAGVLMLAYDQRGFGGAPNRGRWGGEAAMKRDALDIAAAVRAKRPGVPVYYLGLSMGGAVAMTALADDPGAVAGAVLVAPALRGRSALPDYQRWTLDLLAHTVPWYPLTGEGVRIQPSDNIPMLRRMSRDEKVIKATRVDAIHGLVALMSSAQAAAARQRAPLLLLYGLKDDLVPKRPTLAALDDLPATDVGRPPHRLAVYDEGRHMLLRDLAGDRAIQDILAWLADPASPLPSGADKQARARLEAALD